MFYEMKFLSPEVALYLYKSTVHPCMEYCCMSRLVPLYIRICKTVAPSLAACLEPLLNGQNVASLSLFYRYYTLVMFFRTGSNWFHFLFLEASLLVIQIDCMIFLSPFLDVTRCLCQQSFFPRTAN